MIAELTVTAREVNDPGMTYNADRDDLCSWLRTVEVDPSYVKAMTLRRRDDDRYELELTEYVRTERGGRLLNAERTDALTTTRTVPLGEPCTLPSLWHKRVQR